MVGLVYLDVDGRCGPLVNPWSYGLMYATQIGGDVECGGWEASEWSQLLSVIALIDKTPAYITRTEIGGFIVNLPHNLCEY